MIETAQDILNDVFHHHHNKAHNHDLRYTLKLTFKKTTFGCSKPIHIPTNNNQIHDFTIIIPTNTKNNNTKTFKNKNKPNKNKTNTNNLHIHLQITDHAIFHHNNLNIHSEHTINFPQTTLNTILEIATLNNPIKIQIPNNTQPNQMFRIHNQNIPQTTNKTTPRGDHLITIQITVPTELSPHQRQLIKKLTQVNNELSDDETPRKHLLDRVLSLLKK